MDELGAEEALQHCLALLQDPEVRVREQCGELLGALAAERADLVWQTAQAALLSSIEESWVSALPSRQAVVRHWHLDGYMLPSAAFAGQGS